MLLDTTTTISAYDPFGYALTEDVTTSGVDLTIHVERTFKDDTTQWVLGQLQTQKECSTAAGLSQCRTLTRHTTLYGEVHDDTIGSDEGIPDVQLGIVYDRDPFGNVVTVTADDAFGHHRVSGTTYDGEGIYPIKLTNAAMQSTLTEFDARFGTLGKITDPNQLVTQRVYDSLGRLGLEKRPDGTQTKVTLSRTKDGGPSQNAWRVMQQTTTTGGADDTVELDSLGRSIRWWWHGPDTGGVARVMQEIAFDALGEHVARRSVPASEGTAESQLLNDSFQYDALGREVRHTMPWDALVQTSYSALLVTVTDPLGNMTVSAQDPLGRAVTVTDAAQKVTAYTYGPFGALHTVTTPGGALTRTMRDALGRVRQIDDPNRGTTTSIHDGFGELVSSTDALGRMITYRYDTLGRTTLRLDQHGAELATTTWTWDTAAHGIGKLAGLGSADGQKTYTYTALGQFETLTLAVTGQSGSLVGELGYDNLGRVKRITYPAPAGAAAFAVDQDYDAYGHVLTVRDSATSLPYWKLTGVDGAGRYTSEAFGNGVSTTQTYSPDKQALQGIVTQHGATAVQSLAYDYDARLDLASRTDTLQPQNQTERFRYDPVARLTCAYFSPTEDISAPCALAYGYDPSGNGNLTSKSDVGTLVYGDPLHPHAVTGAGTDNFGYDAVGNQIARPNGATVSYTPFDLPKTVTQGAGSVTFAYDGDERRIRKTTPSDETIYFGDLYERVNATGSTTAHRFYVHSPERVVAIVTQGGMQPGTVYVHVDHLGSTDVLTDASGSVVERRSYDPFGQRRNPVWGQPVPASFPDLTTWGFSGHESDAELGLVNMKGRIYDPKMGRFLTTDPLVSEPLSGQSWNPYSYVRNNPLSMVDPSGFEDEPPYVPGTWVSWGEGVSACIGCPLPPPDKTVQGTREAVQVGAATRPSDVSTTGNRLGSAPVGVQVATGFLKASLDFAASLAGTASWRGQFHTVTALAQSAREGARADGVLGGVAGWVNTMNPLYALGVAGVEAKAGIEQGDYERAAAAGTTGLLIVGAVAIGGRGGKTGTLGEGPVTHFTDAHGVSGITGLDVATLKAGQVVRVDALRFGQGVNDYLASEPGRIFLTELGPDASSGQLMQIGVFDARQQFAIQFSRESAFENGVRVRSERAGQNIFTIPGGGHARFDAGRCRTVQLPHSCAILGGVLMSRSLESIVADIENGTDEQRIAALDAYSEQFKTVMAAAAKALVNDDPMNMWVVDRVMRLAHIAKRAFAPLFVAATDPEMKFLCGLLILQFGSRESLPWLLAVASTPGPYRYDVTCQLGALRIPEVQGAILDQLRSASLQDSDQITGLLEAWKSMNETLPEDVRARLHSEEVSPGVKVALKSLKL